MSKGHHPTPSRSGDLASDVPLLAPQAARVGLVGAYVGWAAGPPRALQSKTTSIRHVPVPTQGVATLAGCYRDDFFGYGSLCLSPSTISLFPYEAAVFNSFGAELAFCFCVSSTVDPHPPSRPVFVICVWGPVTSLGNRTVARFCPGGSELACL